MMKKLSTIKPPKGQHVDPEIIESIMTSFKQLGQLSPIGVNTKGTLQYGIHRYWAARFMGWTKIEVVIVTRTKRIPDYTPIKVRQIGKKRGNKTKFQIINGHHRTTASIKWV